MVKSTKKTETNKSNVQFSKGPNDTSLTRLNALAHGMLSKEVVIVNGNGQESTDEFEELRSAMVTDLAPAGALEELLVDQLITFSWRWRRVIKFENAAIRSRAHTPPEDLLKSLSDFSPNPDNLKLEAEELNEFSKALETEDPIQAEPDIWVQAFDVAQDHDTPIEEILGLDDNWDEYDGFTKDQISKVISRTRESNEISKPEFWELVKAAVQLRYQKINADLERLNETDETKKLMASLPDDQSVNKIQRYEAHISRQFYKALHELQRLQAARLSGRVQLPLAVDIDVSAPD